MKTKYTVSVNIQRDANREIHYIPTPNANRAVNQIVNDFKRGVRSFSIVGSYGTGKSSFLWALQQSLISKKNNYFQVNLLSNPKVDFINIVGEYSSIREVFADEFGVKVNRNITQNILSGIYNRYHDLGKKNPLLIICIDEFGKFLEYAANNNPADELYFIQQLAEFANNDDHNIVLITTVHQNIDAYAFSLAREERQEWTKVKGRFREIAFNEPVEQLLYLAAKHIESKKPLKESSKDISKSIDIFNRSKAFGGSQKYVESIAKKLFPLDLMAANVLTLSLQKYGQNERSLFSFLESTDHTGISSFKSNQSTFYNIANVYDYLTYNFYSFLNSKNNPDYTAWASIKTALEKAESIFEHDISGYSRIIKTIGLLNIVASKGAVLDKVFLENYAKNSLGILKPSEYINKLDAFKLIIFRNHEKRYVVFEGTDLDIQSALIEAGNRVNEINDITTLLKKYYDLPPVIAKEHSYKKGTPRLFEYIISNELVNITPVGETDGFINLIFNEKDIRNQIENASKDCKEAILFGFYRNTKAIKELLFEIEKTQKVIEENSTDKVAKKELENILQHQQNLLNHKLLNNFYSRGSEVTWYFKGKNITQELSNKRLFNNYLSTICDKIYSAAPLFNNELVNKHAISSSIHNAKKKYFKALVENWGQTDLGFTDDKFPPEKTIYLSLLKQNGLEPEADNVNYAPEIADGSSFKRLWEVSNEFLELAKKEKRGIYEFCEILSKRPLKLKQGLIDFWIPSYLFIKRDDYALFHKDIYQPDLNEEILELVAKNPDEFQIKTFDIDGVKLDIFNSYRVILDQSSKEKISNKTFIETIKPFVVFYRSLPEYTKHTKRLNSEAISIRDAITNSTDPERIFFEDFPQALGYNLITLKKSKKELAEYTSQLQNAIKELRNFYDELINRFEEFITEDVIGEKMTFEEYKKNLQNRYKKLRKHLLLPNQRVFVQRLDSALEDRKAWLNSIAQAVVGNTLEKLTDEEEPVLFDKFKSMILELDSLTSLSESNFVEEKEDVIGLEISTFDEGVNKKIVRLPKNKKKEVQSIEQALRANMSKDKTVNMVALANVLKEMINK